MSTDEVALPRDGKTDLVFAGEQIGYASSQRGQARRWLEVWIYRCQGSTNRYVVAGAGRTTVPGEVDRRWAMSLMNAQDVVSRLVRIDRNNEAYLTLTAQHALLAASRCDPDVESALALWRA